MSLLATYFILLIHVMDTSIANVALVSITTDLGLDAYDGQWVITAFSIGMAAAVPFVPRFVEWLGAPTALSASLSLSIVSLVLCGLADSLPTLVMARFIQGVASGIVVLLLQRLVLQFAGPENRAYGLALWSSALFIAPAMGPFIGAFAISFLSWRWLFMAQVPLLLGAAVFLVHEFSWKIVKPSARPSMVMAALLTTLVLCVEVGLDSAFNPDIRRQSQVLVCLIGGMIAALLLFRVGRNRESLFDWSLLRSRRYVVYMGQSSLLFSVSGASSVIYTLWLLVHLDISVLDVAKVLVGSSLIAGSCSPFIGRLKQKSIYPHLITAGLVCFMASFFLCTQLQPDSATLFDLILPRLLLGAGTALCSPTGYMAVAELSSERVLAANSLGMYLRTLIDTLVLVLSAAAARNAELLFSERAIATGFGSNLGSQGLGAAQDSSPLLLHYLLSRIAGTQAMHMIYWFGLTVVAALLLNILIHTAAWSRRTAPAMAT